MLITVTTMMWELQYLRLSYADHLGLVCGRVFYFSFGFWWWWWFLHRRVRRKERGEKGGKGGRVREEEEGRQKESGREASKERRREGKAGSAGFKAYVLFQTMPTFINWKHNNS